MAAVVRDIVIEQGATFRMSFTWREGTEDEPGDPISLAGATLRMQVRKAQGEPIILEASTGDGITLGEDVGRVDIVIPASKTSLMTARTARYDLEAVFSEDDVERLLKGRVSTDPNMTQDAGEPVLSR